MKTLIALCVCMLTVFFASAQTNAAVGSSPRQDAGVRVYDINEHLLARTPKWLKTDPNPPLSPRAARSLALKFAKQHYKDIAWRVEKISLIPDPFDDERWFYGVLLSPPTPDNYDGMVEFIRVLVLMDGTVASLTKARHP